MLIYNQSNGQLWRGNFLLGTGYSGFGEGKNNPKLEAVRDVGPIPCGFWKVCGPPYDTSEHGPYVLRIEPEPGTETFGRVGFLMHGDSLQHPGQASKGCIILERRTRTNIYQSGDSTLQVIGGLVIPDLSGDISI